MDGYCQEPWWNGNQPTSEGISLSPWHHSLIPGKVQDDGKAVGRLVLQSEEEGLDECAATRGLRRTFAERLLSVAGCSWEHWMTTWLVVVEKIVEQTLAESVELPFVGLLFPVPWFFTKKAIFLGVALTKVRHEPHQSADPCHHGQGLWEVWEDDGTPGHRPERWG